MDGWRHPWRGLGAGPNGLAIESAIDRVGPEWHDLSKRAKDMGSAAVLLGLLLCGGVWLSAIWRWLAA